MLVPLVLHDVCDAPLKLLLYFFLFLTELEAQFLICLLLDEYVFSLSFNLLLLCFQCHFFDMNRLFAISQLVNLVGLLVEHLPHASTVFLQLSDFRGKGTIGKAKLLNKLIGALASLLCLGEAIGVTFHFSYPSALLLLLSRAYLFQSMLN